MPDLANAALNRLRRFARTGSGGHLLAFVPALTLAAYWLGGEQYLLITALAIPALLALTRAPSGNARNPTPAWGSRIGFVPKSEVVSALDRIFHPMRADGRSSVCYAVEIDELSVVVERHGHQAAEGIVSQAADRLRLHLRDGDLITRLDGGRFAIALAPIPRSDLETAIQLAARLQSAIAEPFSLDATSIYVSCSVGFCQSGRAPEPNGDRLLEAAIRALSAARRSGPGHIRAFAADMPSTPATGSSSVEDVVVALESGQILPWFQPQISTDTGKITGFEALARWVHPERGVIAPSEFLPAIEHAGYLERLGEIVLYHALQAMRAWDKAGLDIPAVGVNYSGIELRNPALVDKLRWELDRFDVSPDRLNVEILETVFATTDDDMITRNIAALSHLGCGIDLDDFGTGHASIASLRRFSVARIKIDRSFVTRVDSDAEQQRMISAILTLAERLGLDTLAEGVETLGEHAMLAQLGCSHVQGFGLARPMPFAETIPWIKAHQAKLLAPPTIGKRAG